MKIDVQDFGENSDREGEEYGAWFYVPSQNEQDEETRDVMCPLCPNLDVIDTDKTVNIDNTEEGCEQDSEDMRDCSEPFHDYELEGLFEETASSACKHSETF